MSPSPKIISTQISDAIDYSELIQSHPWLTEFGRKYILSPDSDGFLSGLLVSNCLDGEVVGFYDGKVMILKDGTDYRSCTFLDMEINRAGVSSIGNHLVEFNRGIAINNHNFNECIQPNILRGFDGKNAFQRKYPFGTIHLLLSILQEGGVIQDLPEIAISPLLFADGVGNNLFGYPENCIDWISYLKINQRQHILNKFLCENDLSFYQIMQYLKIFFAMRDRFNAVGYFDGANFVPGGNNKRTGHKIKISNGQGAPINLVDNSNGLFDLHDLEAKRAQGFIREIARMMGWKYLDEKWSWTDFKLTILQKGLLSGESQVPTMRLNNQTYKALFESNPFSLAMTASNRIEYTIE